MLTDPIMQVMEENVMPWLFDQTMTFLQDDGEIDINAEHQFNEGINQPRADHRLAILNEYKRRDQEKLDREKDVEDTRLAKLARKEDRRIKRRLKAINEMVDAIKKEVLDRGDMRDGVTSSELD
jgi:hypothetical protein